MVVLGDMIPDAEAARGTYEKMATEWYYQIMNEVVGPLTSSQLVACVRTGKVKEDTLIRKDDSQWVPARQVSGLLEAVGNNQTQRICPYCGQKVDRPPTTCHGCNRKLVLSFNSRLTSVGSHQPKGKPKVRDREAEAEAIRRQSDRSEVLRYVFLLVLWMGLLVVAPYLVYLATTGQLFFAGDLTIISVVAVIAVIGGVYFLITRLA
jgi:hypothetical protein